MDMVKRRRRRKNIIHSSVNDRVFPSMILYTGTLSPGPHKRDRSIHSMRNTVFIGILIADSPNCHSIVWIHLPFRQIQVQFEFSSKWLVLHDHVSHSSASNPVLPPIKQNDEYKYKWSITACVLDIQYAYWIVKVEQRMSFVHCWDHLKCTQWHVHAWSWPLVVLSCSLEGIYVVATRITLTH